MNTTLKIDGMHCKSCETLIQMDLEDAGFADKIEAIKVIDSEKNLGELTLKDVSEQEIIQIEQIINKSNDYKVLD